MTTKSDIGRWGAIPEWLLDMEISDRAIRLFGVMAAKFADRETNTAYPSRTTLASSLGCSSDSVDRAIKELEHAGALVVERRNDGKQSLTSVYLLCFVRPTSRTVAATPGRTVAAHNHNQNNHNQEPENIYTQQPLDPKDWPEWYHDLVAIGLRKPLADAKAWLDSKGISEAKANQTAADLRGKWPGQGKGGRPLWTDVWATFRGWLQRDNGNGASPPREVDPVAKHRQDAAERAARRG